MSPAAPAGSTTWLLVRMWPWLSSTNPVPVPSASVPLHMECRPRSGSAWPGDARHAVRRAVRPPSSASCGSSMSVAAVPPRPEVGPDAAADAARDQGEQHVRPPRASHGLRSGGTRRRNRAPGHGWPSRPVRRPAGGPRQGSWGWAHIDSGRAPRCAVRPNQQRVSVRGPAVLRRRARPSPGPGIGRTGVPEPAGARTADGPEPVGFAGGLRSRPARGARAAGPVQGGSTTAAAPSAPAPPDRAVELIRAVAPPVGTARLAGGRRHRFQQPPARPVDAPVRPRTCRRHALRTRAIGRPRARRAYRARTGRNRNRTNRERVRRAGYLRTRGQPQRRVAVGRRPGPEWSAVSAVPGPGRAADRGRAPGRPGELGCPAPQRRGQRPGTEPVRPRSRVSADRADAGADRLVRCACRARSSPPSRQGHRRHRERARRPRRRTVARAQGDGPQRRRIGDGTRRPSGRWGPAGCATAPPPRVGDQGGPGDPDPEAGSARRARRCPTTTRHRGRMSRRSADCRRWNRHSPRPRPVKPSRSRRAWSRPPRAAALSAARRLRGLGPRQHALQPPLVPRPRPCTSGRSPGGPAPAHATSCPSSPSTKRGEPVSRGAVPPRGGCSGAAALTLVSETRAPACADCCSSGAPRPFDLLDPASAPRSRVALGAHDRLRPGSPVDRGPPAAAAAGGGPGPAPPGTSRVPIPEPGAPGPCAGGAAAVDPAADGAELDAQGRGDLLVRQPLDVAEHHGGAELRARGCPAPAGRRRRSACR